MFTIEFNLEKEFTVSKQEECEQAKKNKQTMYGMSVHGCVNC